VSVRFVVMSLADTVMREAEEEREYAMQKGRPPALNCGASVSDFGGSEGLQQTSEVPPMESSDVSLRGAGAVFLTRYGRSFDSKRSFSSVASRESTQEEAVNKSTFHVVCVHCSLPAFSTFLTLALPSGQC
jgi:hypothetical protein